jgi:hypothetical protein
MAALATVAVSSIAACGTSSSTKTSSESPKDAVNTAYTKLLDSDSLTATFKIDESAANLIAISKSGTDPQPLTPQAANAIAGGSVVFAAKSTKGKLADANAADDVAITINAGDDPKLVEIRYVGKLAYARADVPQFVKYGAATQEELTTLGGSSAPAFLKDAIAGKWLQLPLQDAIDAEGGATATKASVSPDQIAGLQGALKNVFAKDVTATKGSTDATFGDEYTLTASSRTVATDLIAAFKTQLSSIPGADKAFADADPAKVVDKNVTVQAFVKSDTLDAVRLDVAQFLTGADLASLGGKPFYVELDFANSADVAAPTGATKVSFGSLISAFSGLSGGSTSTGSASASPLS